MTNPLTALTDAGVSIWLDDLSRARLTSGSLARLVAEAHVAGVTTNPTIFAKAITGSDTYTEQLGQLAARSVDVDTALREITTFDVRWACDVLRPVFDATDGMDGRVSIEVDPRIAHDTQRTIAEATALWWLVDRPNLFVKSPPRNRACPRSAPDAALLTQGRGPP
ncbi:MAG TPA: transaldolase family protein [Pseudonocardiaceae bacterium]|nr:transaldolase family protein [Pseudonocardiaceae bacterium]